MTELTLPENELSLEARIEALLFVSPGSATYAQIATALDVSSAVVEREIESLAEAYVQQNRGLRLQRHRGRVQMTSASSAAGDIERFLGLETTGRLSRAALEALAIVMYRQPVTRPQIDAIRGVNSDGVLKSLLVKGLIQELGRAETPGRPILYGVTTEFLQYFGINSLSELPPLNLEDLEPSDEESTPELLKG